jgi:DNA-binding transcriptional ArsR family regulator
MLRASIQRAAAAADDPFAAARRGEIGQRNRMATGIGQPGLSQQLAELRRAELVTTRRQAKQVFYSIADESVELSVHSIEAVFGVGDPRIALHLGIKQLDARPRPDSVAGAANFVRIR